MPWTNITIASEAEQLAVVQAAGWRTKPSAQCGTLYQSPVNRCWWPAREVYEMLTFGRTLAMNERRESKMWVKSEAASA
jgi:hypothetical protein